MSAPPWASKVKVCVRCGRDCSDVPRTKNPQGRYMCRECYDAEALRLRGREGGAGGGVGAAALKAGVVEVEGQGAIPLEDVLNEGAGLGAHAGVGTARDPRMCASCGMILKESAVICTACGLNSATGLFLNGKPAGAAVRCVKCGYEMRGLKTPRCPECGTINSHALRRKHMLETDHGFRESYLRPAIYGAVGLAVILLVAALGGGWAGVGGHLVVVMGRVVAGAIAFVVCGLIWLGFEAPLPVIAARVAGVAVLASAAADVGGLVPFLGLGVVVPVLIYPALLLDLFDMENSDAAIVTLVTGLVYLGLWLLVLRFI